MRQEKEISKNFYRFWRMSNLRGFLGRCAKVVANSKYFYNFGSMRQNVGELRKKSSPKFGFAKRCRIDPKFGASTQKASQIRHSPKFALFSGFKLWRIVRSPFHHFGLVFFNHFGLRFFNHFGLGFFNHFGLGFFNHFGLGFLIIFG